MQVDAATIIDRLTLHQIIKLITLVKNNIVFIVNKILVLIIFIVNYKINGIWLDIFIILRQDN